MTQDPDQSTSDPDGGSEQAQGEGQVSEVAGLGDDAPISPGDSVAAQPDGESGRTDEGPTGPNAVPDHDETNHR